MNRTLFALITASLLMPSISLGQGTVAKVRSDGKDKIVVESGGEIEVKSGGTLTVNGTIAGGYGIDTAKITSGAFDAVRVGNLDTSKITTGAFAAARIAAGTIDTVKVNAVTSPGAGTLLCYRDDGKIGKVTAAVEAGGMDTGKVTTCAAF